MWDLFADAWSRSTWSAALMMSCIILGLWSLTFWASTLIVTRLTETGWTPAEAQRMASWAGVITNVGMLVAYLLMPWIAGWFGLRRCTATAFNVASLLLNLFAYLGAGLWLHNTVLFIALLPLLGFLTNGVFALYTMWLPEMFPMAQRSLGSGLTFSFGRLLGAVSPTIVGALVAWTGSYPLALASVSIIYIVGLPFITLAPETANKPLPG